mgnify:CR=1 FL=1
MVLNMTALLLYSDTTLASVEQRIVFKILLLTFKSLNDLVPGYIRDLLETYTPSRNLRSSTRNLLVTPRSRLKFYGDCAFSVCAPKLWNNLPEHIKCSLNLTSFNSNLKTYLFKCYLICSFALVFFEFIIY